MQIHPLYPIAERQHGLVTASQITGAGLSSGARRHLVAVGALTPVSQSVFKISGSPSTLDQRRLAAVLDAGRGAALAFESTVDAWGMGRPRDQKFHVVRARRTSPRRTHLGIVHVVRDLRPGHVVNLRGIPVTTPARTVADEASRVGQWAPAYVERILDRAWSNRLLNIGELDNLVSEVRGRGRAGVRLLDQLLDERRGRPRPGSALELRFEKIVADGGLPPLRPQVNVSDDEGWIGCVDYVAEWVPLVVFIDGAAFHTSLTDQRHDDRQTRRLEAAGYRVERISDADVLFREADVLRRLHPLLLVRDRVA